VVQGIVQVGDKVAVLPIGDSASLTRIEHGLLADESSDRLSWAMAGDTADLTLGGLDIARISPGCILSPTHLSLRPTVHDKMQAKILVMENLAVPIIRGAQVLWHMHSLDIPAAVSKLHCTIKRDGTQKDRPRVLTSGVSAVVDLTLQDKACLETYADCRALGRFVLRRGGDTIAVGIIERILV
jgi:elongation factor 1 alpha-like protein